MSQMYNIYKKICLRRNSIYFYRLQPSIKYIFFYKNYTQSIITWSNSMFVFTEYVKCDSFKYAISLESYLIFNITLLKK